MALRATEAAQCQMCESYSRLGELEGVRISTKTNEIIISKDKWSERGGYLGKCPRCGEPVCVHDIC